MMSKSTVLIDNIHSPSCIHKALAESSWWAGAGQEAAECPGSKAGQEQPGLCAQDIKDRDYPGRWGLVGIPHVGIYEYKTEIGI